MKRFITLQNVIAFFLLASSLFFISQYMHLFRFTVEALGKYFDVKWLLFGHVVPAACALLIGPFQFLKKIRNANLGLHRLLGKIYMLCILVSAASALSLTFITTDQVSIMYTVSLWFLLSIWVSTTLMAYLTIRLRKIQEHEQWTVRSYIATFAFVVQNYILKIPSLDKWGSFAEVSPNIFWFSWSIPLFAYQIYLTVVVLNKGTVRT